MKISILCFKCSLIIWHYMRSCKSSRISWLSISIIILCRSLYGFTSSFCTKYIRVLKWLSSSTWLNWIISKLSISIFLCLKFNFVSTFTLISKINITFKSICLSHTLVCIQIWTFMISNHITITCFHGLSCLSCLFYTLVCIHILTFVISNHITIAGFHGFSCLHPSNFLFLN